jgi:hypothetical protein
MCFESFALLTPLFGHGTCRVITHADHNLLQVDILVAPNCPEDVIWRPGSSGNRRHFLLICGTDLCPCADTPVRLTTSPGFVQSRMLLIATHWSVAMVTCSIKYLVRDGTSA